MDGLPSIRADRMKVEVGTTPALTLAKSGTSQAPADGGTYRLFMEKSEFSEIMAYGCEGKDLLET